jgi:hypothetical protein
LIVVTTELMADVAVLRIWALSARALLTALTMPPSEVSWAAIDQ